MTFINFELPQNKDYSAKMVNLISIRNSVSAQLE